MIRRLVMLVALLGGLVCAGIATSPSASAEVDYAGCVIAVDPTVLLPGQEVEVTGSGFEPGFETELIFDALLPTATVLGTVVVEPDGTFTTSVNIPVVVAGGIHSISAPCASDPLAGFASSLVFVIGGGGGGGGGTTGGTAGGTTGGSTGGTAGGTTGGTTGGGTTSPVRLTLSDNEVRRLESFVATLTGARPGTAVEFAQLSTRRVVGTAIADASGTARLTMSFPKDAELGAHQVEARGTAAGGSAFDVFAPITVIADSAVPRTGADSGRMALLGAGAVGLGAVLVAAGRRRRSTIAVV